MPIWGYSGPLKLNMCTSSLFTSGRADEGLFSRYRSLKVVGVMQYGYVVYFDT